MPIGKNNNNRGTGSSLNQSYNSFSGVDIKAVFGSVVIGELQAISYSVSREKAPLYTMGSADCRAYSRGKRGIAGTLIFLMFDRHALLGNLAGQGGTEQPAVAAVEAAGETAAVEGQAAYNTYGSDSYAPWLDTNETGPQNPTSGNVGTNSSLGSAPDVVGTGAGVTSLAERKTPWYSDQLLPFDVTLAAANEYGSFAVMRIYGCEILNEGYGVSIDDIVSEQQMSYVARKVHPWSAVPKVEAQPTAAEAAGEAEED